MRSSRLLFSETKNIIILVIREKPNVAWSLIRSHRLWAAHITYFGYRYTWGPWGTPFPLICLIEWHIWSGRLWSWGCCEWWWRYWRVYIGRQRHYTWHSGVGWGQVLVRHPCKIQACWGKLVTWVRNWPQPVRSIYSTSLRYGVIRFWIAWLLIIVQLARKMRRRWCLPGNGWRRWPKLRDGTKRWRRVTR